MTDTAVAGLGPLSVTVRVNVIVSPTVGVGLLTVFVTARSVCCGVTVTVAVLSVGSVSYSSELATAAFTVANGASMRAVMTSTTWALRASGPTSHSPVVGS